MKYIVKKIENIDWNYVEDLIQQGKTAVDIGRLINVSYLTVLKHVKIKLPQSYDKLKENKKLKHSYWGSARKGKRSKLKGRTYEDILGSKEKAKQRKKHTSNWMKTERNIRRFCTRISKGQRKLYEKIKQQYSDAILEYPIYIEQIKTTIFLDVAVVSLKLNFEYDGKYWHDLNEKQGKLKDIDRDKYLKELGWKVIRVSDGQ